MITFLRKPSVWAFFALSFSLLFSSCDISRTVENKYLTVQVPLVYVDQTDFSEMDVLYLDCNKKDGLQSILSIDNIADLLIQPNSQTILEDTPVEVLSRRLRSIDDSIENEPSFTWKNFVITEEPKAITFKGLPAAEGVFEVDEYIKSTDQVIKKRVKRLVVFVDNDLWNIVLAPSRIEQYSTEMEVFETILESMVIKVNSLQ